MFESAHRTASGAGRTRPSLFRELARVCRTDAESSPSMAEWDHLHEVAQRWDARADALEEELILGSVQVYDRIELKFA